MKYSSEACRLATVLERPLLGDYLLFLKRLIDVDGDEMSVVRYGFEHCTAKESKPSDSALNAITLIQNIVSPNASSSEIPALAADYVAYVTCVVGMVKETIKEGVMKLPTEIDAKGCDDVDFLNANKCLSVESLLQGVANYFNLSLVDTKDLLQESRYFYEQVDASEREAFAFWTELLDREEVTRRDVKGVNSDRQG